MKLPLSILDLAPISAGSTVAEALRNTVDLARAAERAGYRRYWLAEHHLNPGVAGRRRRCSSRRSRRRLRRSG